jgi:hypothetical protein
LACVETVPVELARPFVPRPIGWLAIDEDDPCVLVPSVGVTPDVVVTNGELRSGAEL